MYAVAHRHFDGNNKVKSVTIEYFTEDDDAPWKFMVESVTPGQFPEVADGMRSNGIEVYLSWEN